MTNIKNVFGHNLRELCQDRPSLAFVARELGLNTVQMNRMLKGESFPKPDLLVKICDYFSVDARILTSPLKELKLSISVGGETALAILDQACFSRRPNDLTKWADTSSAIPNGLHCLWRKSTICSSDCVCLLVRFFSIGNMKLMRCHFPLIGNVSVVPENVKRHCDREVRGVVNYHQGGFSIIAWVTSDGFINFGVHQDQFPLYSNLRPGHVHMAGHTSTLRNEVPAIFEILEQKTSVILSAARKTGYHKISEAPEPFRSLFTET